MATQIEIMEQKFELGDRVWYIDEYQIKNDIVESIAYIKSAPYARKGSLQIIKEDYAVMVYDSTQDTVHTLKQNLCFSSKEELLKSL